MLWYTPYGLTRPKQKTTITGLRFENDNQVVTATVPVGQYLSGLQASNHGLLVTINQGDPQVLEPRRLCFCWMMLAGS